MQLNLEPAGYVDLVTESRHRRDRAEDQAGGILHIRPMFQLLITGCHTADGGECDYFPNCSGDSYRWTPELQDAKEEGLL